jgi:ABC-2 type transport system ATP-binding protein
VLGPNGAGKTTTIEILEGLAQPTSGSVQVLGMTWRDNPSQIRQRIGVSLQDTQLSERLSVRETLQLFLSFYRDGRSVDEVLELVALTEKSKAWIKNLSGGQKQRLAVATAIVGKPDLLFLDEPTTGLDPASRRQLWNIIRSFNDRDKTVLLTTHYMEEAERLCDRVAIVDQGQVIALGTPHELIRTLGAEHMIEFRIEPLPDDFVNWLGNQHLGSLDVDGEQVKIAVAEPHEFLPVLFDEIKRQRCQITSLITRHASLEDVFVHLTGRQLRDE